MEFLTAIRDAFMLPDPTPPTQEEIFVAIIEGKGFYYNTELSDITGDRWSRKWTTEHGHDSILEIYCKSEGNWIQQMVSADGEVFYEECVNLDEKTS
jgi:hypothetical protein|tara:strand:+ start:1038 stop:1328 length:291 start_codon:yes stop_codon:yes gene_type:complete